MFSKLMARTIIASMLAVVVTTGSALSKAQARSGSGSKAQTISGEGDRIIADIGQRQTDHASEIEAVRKGASAPQTQSTADRLARLG